MALTIRAAVQTWVSLRFRNVSAAVIKAACIGVFVATAVLAPGRACGGEPEKEQSISFEMFASFQRVEQGNPLLACEPPKWAAAAHAIVVRDTVHYLWARRGIDRRWLMMHSRAPVSDPAAITHDPRNPVLVPSAKGFDNAATEYPYPFRNPADGRFYVYYLGRGENTPKQTGLLVSDGDFGKWTRVRPTPVIPADAEYDRHGSSHPSIAVAGETIHIIYTGKSRSGDLTICHATAPTSDPAAVTKDPRNPIFSGTGQAWDSRGVREAELLKGPHYFHITYGGYSGKVWRIGHVRTKDFRTFEPNPYNPVFTPSSDPEAWDCDGILTPHVFELDSTFYMIYAGKKGKEWQTGLAKARWHPGGTVHKSREVMEMTPMGRRYFLRLAGRPFSWESAILR